MVTRSAPFRPVSEALFASRLLLVRVSAAARPFAAALVALALLAGAYAIALAQVTGERGIAPTASSADIEVRGIEIDVTADSAEEARQKGWREAQRLAWERAGGPDLPDSEIAGLVSSIVIQREQLGPRRYIATLGVIFDRQRAGDYLGGRTQQRGSAPMLVIPVMASAGTYTSFEVRNPWQRAWARFNPGASRIDYVRPSGAGGDSLLLNFGQTGRRSRAWWRRTLDQYSAADVLVPAVRLEHQFPGGPIEATFTARYGPDSTVLESFTATAADPRDLDETLQQGVARLDTIYEEALAAGKLRPDPTLSESITGPVDPALQRLIDMGRAIRAREDAAVFGTATGVPVGAAQSGVDEQAAPAETPQAILANRFLVQFATPDADAFDAALTGVRGTPGVRSLSVTSTAMGGSSVMNVSFEGSAAELADALRARGFAVNRSGNTLAISR
jgi:hypothetical protein